MQFNIIIYDFNSKEFLPYDVMPYLIDEYKKLKDKDIPKTEEEIRKFIEGRSMYRYWSRCEYEIILSDWPPSGISEKWDVHKQIMMNIDIITKLFMKEI